jgi:CBS domain-containing protein
MPNELEETVMSSKREGVLIPTIEHATVGDAMRPGIFSCSPDASAVKVAREMALHHVHCVFVMHPGQGSEAAYVWGIVSDLDLMRAVLSGRETGTAGSLAREPMVTVRPEMPLVEAAALMVTHQITHLVVVDSETLRPSGVLSTTDVAEIFAWGEA